MTVPLLDDSTRIAGTVLVTGGTVARAMWIPARDDLPGWHGVLAKVRSLDPPSGRRDQPVVHGKVRAVPLRNGTLLAAPVYRWQTPGTPTLQHTVVFAGDSGRRVPNGELSGVIEAALPSSLSPAELRERVAVLHEAMSAALSRGDWLAFGKAFDALGRIVGRGGAVGR
jgi:hypothetical protein